MAYGEPTGFRKKDKYYFVHGVHGAKSPELAGRYDTKPEAMKAAQQMANEEEHNVYISDPKGNEITVKSKLAKNPSGLEERTRVRRLYNPESMDGQTRYLKIRELETELHSGDASEERELELLAQIRKLKAGDKKSKAPRTKSVKTKAKYMGVLGGYALDMSKHGALVGFIDPDGNVHDRQGKLIGHKDDIA